MALDHYAYVAECEDEIRTQLNGEYAFERQLGIGTFGKVCIDQARPRPCHMQCRITMLVVGELQRTFGEMPDM